MDILLPLPLVVISTDLKFLNRIREQICGYKMTWVYVMLIAPKNQTITFF